jgi:hypothetical protein
VKSDFEFAYALFLTDGDYRKMMIDCGVKALQENIIHQQNNQHHQKQKSRWKTQRATRSHHSHTTP